MRKVVFFCLLVLLSLNVFSQSPRLIGMGNIHGYIADDNDIFTYPATINSYGNTVYAYLGNSSMENDSYNFGINYELAEAVLGLYFNKELPYLAKDEFIDCLHTNLEKNFQMFLGFNNNMALKFSLAVDSYSEPAYNDKENTETAIALGLGAGYSTENRDLGLNVMFPTYSKETYTGRSTLEEKESIFLLDFHARDIFIKKGNLDIVTKLDFMYSDGVYDDGLDTDDDPVRGVINVSLGIAGVVNVNDKNKIVLGMTPFGYDSRKKEEAGETLTMTTFIFPAFNIGLESQVCKWLVLRTGATQYYYITKHTVEDSNNEDSTTDYDSDFFYDMGLGILYKNFTLDCVFNEDFLHNGANFITGQTTNNIFGEIMLKYNF